MTDLEEAKHVLEALYDTYSDNTFVQGKLIHHIKHNLSHLLVNIKESHDEREKRKKKLTDAKDIFTEQFLNKTKYYYNPSTNLFFHYDDENYSIINEDDIQHELLTSITHNKQIVTWKYKIKNNIIKQIRERDALNSIPESSTIQNVLNNLYPSIFKNRNHAKYFLSIIGDIMLKKSNLIYFISPKAKNFMTDLTHQGCMLFGTINLLQSFKFKYYDHNYADCRLIDVNDHVKSLNIWNKTFKQQMINFFCVATYYSHRYGSADNFLTKHSNDNQLVNHSLYLKKNTEETIINKFITNYTEEGNDCSISWKNILYLWKQFMDEEKIPNVFFSASLKTKLVESLKYNEKEDAFLNLTSKHIPIVSKFLEFWEDHIEINSDEMEIDELCSLFNNWHGKSSLNIDDTAVLGLVKHFCTDIVVEDDKYLVDVECKLWDKKSDIIFALEQYKQDCLTDEFEASQPLYNAYEAYCKYMSKGDYTVSKRYFERFFMDTYGEYLDEDNFIKKTWWCLPAGCLQQAEV